MGLKCSCSPAVDATYACVTGSVPSVCQDSEDKELEQCFPERFMCNLNAECSNAEDEKNCTHNDGSVVLFVIQCQAPLLHNYHWDNADS